MVGAVVGEYLGATRGLGYVISQAEGTFDTTGVFAGMTVLADGRRDRQRGRDAAGAMAAAMEGVMNARCKDTEVARVDACVAAAFVVPLCPLSLVSCARAACTRRLATRRTCGSPSAARTRWSTCRRRSRRSSGSTRKKGSTSSCRTSPAARRRCRRWSAAAPTSCRASTITRFRWRPKGASSSRSSRCCAFPGWCWSRRRRAPARVTTIGDLKGRIAGVTTAGSSSQMLLTYMLQRNGVAADAVSITRDRQRRHRDRGDRARQGRRGDGGRPGVHAGHAAQSRRAGAGRPAHRGRRQGGARRRHAIRRRCCTRRANGSAPTATRPRGWPARSRGRWQWMQHAHAAGDRRQDAEDVPRRRRCALRRGAEELDADVLARRHDGRAKAPRPCGPCSPARWRRSAAATIDLSKTYTNEFIHGR